MRLLHRLLPLLEGRPEAASPRLAAAILPAPLLALSWVYAAFVHAARARYHGGLRVGPLSVGRRPRRRLPVPVVSVGNITWGGTGKTPMAELVARLLQYGLERGQHDAAGGGPRELGRGERNRTECGSASTRVGARAVVAPSISSSPLAHSTTTTRGVDDRGTGTASPPRDDRRPPSPECMILSRGYGDDEEWQMRGRLPDVPMGVGSDRWVAGTAVLAAHPTVRAAVLDDGLQHWALERDMDIVMINGMCPFGSGHLIPRGVLREPVKEALQRAQVVCIHHADLIVQAAAPIGAAGSRRRGGRDGQGGEGGRADDSQGEGVGTKKGLAVAEGLRQASVAGWDCQDDPAADAALQALRDSLSETYLLPDDALVLTSRFRHTHLFAPVPALLPAALSAANGGKEAGGGGKGVVDNGKEGVSGEDDASSSYLEPRPPRPFPPLSLETLRGRDVVAFCGVGAPEPFRVQMHRLASRVGIRRLQVETFLDHHAYSPQDLQNLLDAAARLSCRIPWKWSGSLSRMRLTWHHEPRVLHRLYGSRGGEEGEEGEESEEGEASEEGGEGNGRFAEKRRSNEERRVQRDTCDAVQPPVLLTTEKDFYRLAAAAGKEEAAARAVKGERNIERGCTFLVLCGELEVTDGLEELYLRLRDLKGRAVAPGG